MSVKITHLTSAHPRFDTRIFLKECRSLAAHGYLVTLIVADGLPDEMRDSVIIKNVGSSSSRLKRMFLTTSRVFIAARRNDAELYHLHDPELIPVGLLLKLLGKRVIFDAHEDLPKQLKTKRYLNPITRRIFSWIAAILESFACARFDGIVTATPSIRNKFIKINEKTIDINNYPILGELAFPEVEWSARAKDVAYVGGITEIRGVAEAVQAMTFVRSEARLKLAGRFAKRDTRCEVSSMGGWVKVDELGELNREEVRGLLGDCSAGLVTFLPAPNHIDSQPNKMFEYMSASLPVIASHFPMWREIIEGNNCGLCVDPEQPKAIADAIDYLAGNPLEAESMGKNGFKAVLEKYNWRAEEARLLDFYKWVLRG